jgi:hypothetical protein
VDHVKVIVECGNDPGCYDVELHVTCDPSFKDETVTVHCVASYGKNEDAQKHAARLRAAMEAVSKPASPLEERLKFIEARRAHKHAPRPKGSEPSNMCWGPYETCGEHHQHTDTCGGRSLRCRFTYDEDIGMLLDEVRRLQQIVDGFDTCDDCGAHRGPFIDTGDHHGGIKHVCLDRNACHGRGG